MDFREFVLSTWNCCTMVGIAKYVAMWVAFKPFLYIQRLSAIVRNRSRRNSLSLERDKLPNFRGFHRKGVPDQIE